MEGERSSWLWQWLRNPSLYALVPKLLGAPPASEFTQQYASEFTQQYIAPKKSDKILDIGCGPAAILSTLENAENYVGFDPIENYIVAARAKYGSVPKLSVDRIDTFNLEEEKSFDISLALGVLHHLPDDIADQLMSLASRALKPDGRLITLDTGFTENQPFIARLLAKLDRGASVRTPEAYVLLAERHFRDVNIAVMHDRMRVPYTHVIMTCQQPRQDA